MWRLPKIVRRRLGPLLRWLADHPSARPVRPGLLGLKRIDIGPGGDSSSRLAVLVLRAVAPTSEALPPDRVRFRGDRQVVSDDQAAERLAGMRKPVECTVTVCEGVMDLSCEPLGPKGQWLMTGKEALASQVGGWLGALEYEAVQQTGISDMLFVGRGEYAVVPVEVAERFEQEYVILCSYTMIGDLPQRFGDATTATARWYTPSEGQTLVTVQS